uniref:DNA helicase Pif1-like protein n=1 Tax=Tanacetum cinerariifolium TaxID=118510 RepID=A0A699K441_TANCI|nr:DNA helicase Pif1-like protein [Tanacetum cinerariifolium]
MPRLIASDHQLTLSCIPLISKEEDTSDTMVNFYKNIETRFIHEGKVVETGFVDPNKLEAMLGNIGFNCLYLINKSIVPLFILEFYSQVQLCYNEDGEMLIIFGIRGQFISYTIFEFAQILRIPSKGKCSFTDEWSLDSLLREQYPSGRYHTELPTLKDIRTFIQIERAEHTRLIKGVVTYLDENQILTKEI